MASTFSDLGIELMSTGENAGTWGDKTNTNLQIVEKAIAGYVEKSIAGGAQTTALSITDGTTTESDSIARHAVIKLTGSITGNQIVTVPDSIEKVYIITNGTSGAYTVQFKTASGTGITFGVSEKTTKLVYSDGTNLVDAGFGGALDIEGRELVLDADGDTTITADTDDQIDIKIAGADDFQFTANTFTAQSGSSIVVPDGGLTFGSTAIAATAAELNIMDGGTSATSTTVADADRVVLNDNGTMVQVAVTDLAAYFDDEITAMPNLTSVGTLTTLTVDDITINGSTISDSGSINIESGSSLTVDVDGGINLDAGSGGNGIKIKDDATEILQISNSSSDVTIETKVSDKDLFIKGNDGGSTVTALTFDMSDAGKATFGGNVIVTGDLTVSGDDITMGTNTAGNILVADGTNFNSIAAGDLSEISTIANDDVFLAVDTSGGGLKKVARSTVVSGLATSAALSNVSEDTTPQLGGNLDLNGSDIVTTSNADLELAPNGTGHVTIKGNTNPGTIQFNCENNSHGQQLKPQPHSVGSSAVHTLPNVTGELMPGKIEGTNFTGSLLVGHTTSGTLNAAQHNTGVGITALDALTSGDQNTALGGAALTAVTTGNDNIGIGYNAGSGITGAPGNTIIGVNAFVGSATDANSGYNTVVGQNAMNVASGATFNTALGRDAGREVSTGDYNIFLGYNAGANDSTAGITTGSGNVIIGTVDPASRTGDRQLKIAGNDGSTTTTWISGDSSGNLTFKRIDTGDDNPYVLTLQTGETDIAASDILGSINFQAPDEGTGTDAILVAAGIEAVSEGDFSSSNNATKLSFKTAASEAAAEKMSLSSAGVLTVSSTITADSKDVILGKFEGTNFTNGLIIGHSTTGTLNAANNNVGIGHGVFESLTSGDNNTGAGVDSLAGLTIGVNNTGFGSNTLKNNSVGSSNTAVGYQAMEASAGGNSSTAIGSQALKTALAGFNTAVGVSAGEGMVGQDSHNNLVLGYQSGDNITSGAGNVIIGSVNADSATGDRQLKIAGYDGTTTTTWISGDSNGVVTFSQTPVNSAGAAFVTDDPTALAIALG